jgi:prepilin-type N-terminal cleavage/methylation domain-containing protein
MSSLHIQHQKGFTLVEMLVSLALFTVVVTMSVGTLLVLIDANGRAQSTQLVVTNLTFALDSMTREIRESFNWYCGETNGNSSPTIEDDDEVDDDECNGSSYGDYLSIREGVSRLTAGKASGRITYFFDDDYWDTAPRTSTITDHGAILRKIGGGADGTPWLPLTSEEVDINVMRFVVTGTERLDPYPGGSNNDALQPVATLFIKGEAGNTDKTKKEFLIQSSITQRVLDI